MGKRSDYLDCLRALAILPVMMHHVYSPAAPGGSFGVSVFFVLSGYLIGQTVLADTGSRAQRALKFSIRRVFRIAPLYYLAVATVLWFSWSTDTPSFALFRDYLPSILGLQPPTPWMGYGVGVWWTLSVEVVFYALVGLLLTMLGSEAVVRLAPVLLALSLALASQVTGILQFLPELFLGLALNAPQLAAQRARKSSSIAMAAISAIALLYATADITGMDRATYVVINYVVAVCTAIAICFAGPSLTRTRMPMLGFLGRISFSLYLVHALVLDFAGPWYAIGPPEDIARQLRFFALSIAISTATYFIVEKPAIRAGRAICWWIDARAPAVTEKTREEPMRAMD